MSYQYDPTSCILPPSNRTLEILDFTLYIQPDFDKQILFCNVKYGIRRISNDCNDNNHLLRLDVHRLHIDYVKYNSINEYATTPSSLQYCLKENLHAASEMCSNYLQIEVPKSIADSEFIIEIGYNTDKECSAVQWLKPEQTFSKSHPYVYTQLQAIHARSLIPSLDSPSFKCKYRASIDLKNCQGVTAVMAAQRLFSESPSVLEFSQPIPVPSYLIAFAIGNIQGIPIGPRSIVYGEPGQVQDAAKEFSETESYLALAEKVAGSTYIWTDYNILVLPPGFPYGGMENPCLTFISPSLIVGDKSLIDVIVHEICHSWTGNSVTSSTWEHFWLNEGWTMLLERKILAEIHDESYRHFSALLGLEELSNDIDQYNKETDPSPWTRLVVNLSGGKDPDDAFSHVPYEKGHTLLFYLESIVGKDAFLDYLQKYLVAFATQSITTNQWKAHLILFFPPGTFDMVDWDTWLYGSGMPPIIPAYDTAMKERVNLLAEKIIFNSSLLADTIDHYHTLSVLQKVTLFNVLMKQKQNINEDLLRRMFKLYSLSKCINVEILFSWLFLSLTCGIIIDIDLINDYLGHHGRMSYLRPIYRELGRIDIDRASGIFNTHKDKYHPITVKMIKKDLENISKTKK